MFIMLVGVTMNGANGLMHIHQGNYGALKWDALGIALSLAGGGGGGGGLTLAGGGMTAPFAVNFSKGAVLTAHGGSLTIGGAGLVTAMNRATPPSHASPPPEGPYPNRKSGELADELKWVDEAGIKPVEAGTQEFWDMMRDNPVVKWAVTKDGKLHIVPYKVNVGRIAKEIPHTAITRGEDVLGAGEASLRGVDKVLFNKQSGHYWPANYSAGEIQFRNSNLKVQYVDGSLVP
jgi:hypothetical protein